MAGRKRFSFWMPWYIDDHRRDTSHLSTLEDGAYRRLLDQCWINGGHIPKASELRRRIAGLTPKEWKESQEVIMSFFCDCEEGFAHKRIDQELSVMQQQISQKSKAGKASARAREAAKIANGCSTAVQRQGYGDATAIQPRAGVGVGVGSSRDRELGIIGGSEF